MALCANRTRDCRSAGSGHAHHFPRAAHRRVARHHFAALARPRGLVARLVLAVSSDPTERNWTPADRHRRSARRHSRRRALHLPRTGSRTGFRQLPRTRDRLGTSMAPLHQVARLSRRPSAAARCPFRSGMARRATRHDHSDRRGGTRDARSRDRAGQPACRGLCSRFLPPSTPRVSGAGQLYRAVEYSGVSASASIRGRGDLPGVRCRSGPCTSDSRRRSGSDQSARGSRS